MSKELYFDTLKFAVEAFTRTNQQTNRLWSICGLLSLYVIAHILGASIPPFVPIKTEGEDYLHIVIIILSVTNMAFCVSAANSLRVDSIYQGIQNHYSAKTLMITDRYSWWDLAQGARLSSLNRLYLLFKILDDWFGNEFYSKVKGLYDFIFYSFPVLSMTFGVCCLDQSSSVYILSCCAYLISLFFTILLLRIRLMWPNLPSHR